MKANKKELEVAALENGTVIDHIPSDQLFKVVSLLGIEKLGNSITIGNNLVSKKIGHKGIIKIADLFFEEDDINKIALIAPNAKINIIRNYQVTEKRMVSLPDEIHGIIKCGNPKCITNNEPMKTIFYVVNKDSVEVKCKYCERAATKDEIEIR
ncbi:aspartate carbamoyltransferase regulatory subunit [Coprobacter tertius]|uniref:Aspartate carbamoyltransferase regulatory chain n=1 Tax=Coprobacter tertius TaxID=2944915 RepID=A0ABT1MJU8_9BACT|nr:aspartate carbamoyltransferase regulatory subunit [Coprobacter tertius]MCP9612885.1 aspartate carbamoyltransferase regulatory subunit [Coprobacter tertius]